MSDSPWSITSTKRRRTATTPAPRKRVRISNDVSDANGSRTRSTSNRRTSGQQTLTQIDFVTTSSFEDGDDLVQGEQEGNAPASGPPRRRLKKRDSTLTQMDFFDPSAAEASNLSDVEPLGVPQTESSSGRRPRIPAFDGTQDDPPKPQNSMAPPRSRHKSPRNTKAVKKTERAKNMEDQVPGLKQQPRKRRKVHIDDGDKDHENRRRSGRIAAATASDSLPTPPTQEQVPTPASRRSRPHIDATGRPVLEIQDSTDFTEPSLDANSAMAFMMAQPTTPTRNRDRIPSSQTPESLTRTRRTRSNKRQPLAELSTNIQKTPSRAAKSTKLASKSPQKQSPRRKVCVLKVPPRALLPRSNRIDDSQQDVWSVQATSSPRREKGSSQAREMQPPNTGPPDESRTPRPSSKSQSNGPSIQESTPRADVDTQQTLPDIADIFALPVASLPKTPNKGQKVPVPATTSTLDVRQEPGRGAAIGHGEMHVDQEPVNMIPELEQVSSDQLSDFGSPVANDTQFVKSLHKRVSSPIPKSDDERHRAQTAPAVEKHTPPEPRALSRASVPASPPKLSPLPAPRLVTTSPLRTAQRQVAFSSTESLSLPATNSRPAEKAIDRVRITKVPLNDTNDYQRLSSSSSPLLPLPPMLTQKSVHPASIPHPSQVSTQAPSTQGFYFPTSSAPNSFPAPRGAEVERITIKDSSSVPARLSQFQQHGQDEELEGNDEVRLVDASDDDDDLDLDPATWKPSFPGKATARRAQVSGHFSGEEDITQTPTQKSRVRNCLVRRDSNDQSSPIITNATTRSQRDAELEIIPLPSSSPPTSDEHELDKRTTPRARNTKTTMSDVRDFADDGHAQGLPSSSPISSSVFSPSPPRQLQRKYTPIPGFDNDTQSDFTQDGHVTAAYVHRMREEGLLPKNYTPKPFKPKNWSKSMRSERQRERAKAGTT